MIDKKLTKLNLIQEYSNNTIWKNLVLANIVDEKDFWDEEVDRFLVHLKQRVDEIIACPASLSFTYYSFKSVFSVLQYMMSFFMYYKNIHNMDELDTSLEGIESYYKKLDTFLNTEVLNNESLISRIKELKFTNITKYQESMVDIWLDKVFEIKQEKAKKIEVQKLRGQLVDKINEFNKNQDKTLWKQNHSLFISKKNFKALDGLPSEAYQNAIDNATNVNKKGYVFYLEEDTVDLLLSTLNNRALRRRVYEKYCMLNSDKRIKENNDDVLRDILSVKQKIAKTLDFKNYSELVLSNFVINTTDKAQQYLNDVDHQLKDLGAHVEQDIKTMAQTDKIKLLKPWDISYYYHKITKNTRFKSTSSFSDYYCFEDVMPKLIKFISKQFDLSFQKYDHPLATKENELYFYEIKDNKTPRVGYLLFSPFLSNVRITDSSFQVSMTEMDCIGNEVYIPSVQFLNLNIEKHKRRTPMGWGDLYVLLHEFGHFLHSMFGSYKEHVNNSKKISWDLIELPSELFAHLIYEENFMTFLSSHKSTKQKIPEILLHNVIEKNQYFEGYEIYRKIKKYKVNLDLHTKFKPYSKLNPHTIVDEQLSKEGIIYNIARDGYMTESHHETDYAPAGYVYLYSDMLAFQIFDFYKINDGFFKPNALRNIYENILNTDNNIEIKDHLKKFIDLKSINMLKYLQKGWNIDLYGTTTWKEKERNLSKAMFG